VLEGVALSARELLERMARAGSMPSTLRAVGGATRSRLWMQILADVTGLPLEVAGMQEAASFGAAMLAGRSVGLIPPDVEWPAPSTRLEPRAQYLTVYDKLFERFQKERE
jgi:sugar (pentulose or hexulose) kinase